MIYAHSVKDWPESEWEPLLEHCEAVAFRARAFAEHFGAGAVAQIAGLLHDFGKAKPAFQRYLRGGPREPHSAEGAKIAVDSYGPVIGRMLAFCIAAHHAGLANGSMGNGATTPLDDRLRQTPPSDFPGLTLPPMPKGVPVPLQKRRIADPFTCAFFVRMIFSTLVDADRLATEAFYAARGIGTARPERNADLGVLRTALDRRLEAFPAPRGEVDRLRAEILAAARAAAARQPGLFTFTVPTGGGKTLSSLAFALQHAIAHGLRRIIYVAPFTAILEQTADVFRQALEDHDAVLEHHSAFDMDERHRGEEEGEEALRRAAENWDRPVIVTTTVQLFESLFSAHPSRCRKLHQMARSVIVLDEAQALPLHVLRPCLAALKELADGYGTSVVLCTATQPAVRACDGFEAPEALCISDDREIAPEPRALYGRLRRVRFEQAGVLSDEEIVDRLKSERQALVIVNNRRHARELFKALKEARLAGARHLTTAMTPAHRRAALAGVLEDLKSQGGRPCLLVATSLIEAGVDVSFPMVMRAVAGLDSIAQAAGRCNRSGELGPEAGRVVIFAPELIAGRLPPPELKRFAQVAERTLAKHTDPLSLDAIRSYFAELYWRRGLEELDATKVAEMKGISNALDEYGYELFASIGATFRLIENTMLPVIIPAEASMGYGAPADLLRELEVARFAGGLARRLQNFVVPVPKRAHSALKEAGAIRVVQQERFGEQFVVLENSDLYDAKRGLDWDEPTFRTAESNVI